MNRRGPLLMVLASLLFTVMVSLVKVARQTLGPLEIIAWRSLVSVLVAGLVLRRGRSMIVNKRVFALRVVCGFGAMVSFFTAAKGLSVAELSLISKVQPILVAGGAPLVLGAEERSEQRTWMALALGVVGCALLLWPRLSPSADETMGALATVFGLLAVLASVFSAVAHIAVRTLGKTDDPRALVFWFQAVACVLAFGAQTIFFPGGLNAPELAMWPLLVGIGLTAVAGQLCMTMAYAADRASRVAAASYAAPLFAFGFDLALFGDWPTPWMLAGGALVVGGGVQLFRRADRAS